MLAHVLAFLASLFNLALDTIVKIGLGILIMLLLVFAITSGFAIALVSLLT